MGLFLVIFAYLCGFYALARYVSTQSNLTSKIEASEMDDLPSQTQSGKSTGSSKRSKHN